MARHHALLITLGCCLLVARLRLGVEASGRHLLATTNPTRVYYDSSKDYMLLGCFPAGLASTVPNLNEFQLQDTGMSADRCAAMARAAEPPYSAFTIVLSEWCQGFRSNGQLPGLLTQAPDYPERTCEMQCSDPHAADVSCGGTMSAVSAYALKGVQGYSDLGCYVYNTTGHPGSTDLTGSSAGKMMLSECNRLSAAFDFFGLVNGSRCLGLTSLQQAAVAAAQDVTNAKTGLKSDYCRVRCTGSANATCGGKATMQLYARNKPAPQLAPVPATPGDYIYLGCVADQDDLVYDDQESRQKAGTPGLPSLLLTTRDMYVTPAGCASAAKRAGKRFFGLQRHTCRAGVSLIKALRHSARRGVCDTLCAPDNICRGGGKFPLATSLYVSKAGKDYTNLGCYALRPDRPPLPQLLLDSPKMTPGFCYKKSAAYKFFAVFNGTRCYAGNDLAPSLRHGRGSTGCTTPCGGNKQRCGGVAAFMVYVSHASKVAPPVVELSVGPAGDGATPMTAPNARDLQRQRLLEGRDAMDPTWSSYCMKGWGNTSYPCNGDATNWRSVFGCSDGMVTILTMEHCILDGTLPTTWGALPGLEGLTTLEVYANRLKGTLPAAWAGLTSLENLNAGINQLTGLLPESWGSMTGLQTLTLQSNRLTGQLPKSWGNMSRLSSMQLSGNQLTGTLPAAWGGAKSLRELYITNNRLTGPLPNSWINMTALQRVYLSDNQLTGTLPTSWSRAKLLKDVYLSINRLKGPLPASWGSLTRLSELYLDNNTQLTGTLPASWSGLTSLDTLQLTNASGLSGTLPCTWSSISSNLRVLYLAGTQLKGCYPSAKLKGAGEFSAEFGPSPVSGVRGMDPGCPPCS